MDCSGAYHHLPTPATIDDPIRATIDDPIRINAVLIVRQTASQGILSPTFLIKFLSHKSIA